MTEQTGRPATKAFDPYADRDGESAVTPQQPANPPATEGDRGPGASMAEAIDRATAGLGDDDGKH